MVKKDLEMCGTRFSITVIGRLIYRWKNKDKLNPSLPQTLGSPLEPV